MKEGKPPAAALDAIMETIRRGALLLGVRGEIVAANAHGLAMLDADGKDLHGTLFHDVVEVRPAAMFGEALSLAWSGQDASVVARVRQDGKKPRELLADLSIMGSDIGGKPLGVVAQLTDLESVRRRQQRDREFYVRRMQAEKMQALEQFAAGVAHELNNPLASVVGFSEMLLMDEVLEESVAEQIRYIVEQGRRAANIIQKLSTFANPMTGARENIDLTAIITAALELQELELRTHHIRVELHPDASLPLPVVDKHQLVQVLCAIMNNSMHAMHEAHGGGVIRVNTGSPRPGWVRVTVRDDGPGIPNQVLPRIFDPFFTTRDIGRGAGIGLSMVYSIVKEHAGEVMAYNNVDGPGATLIVELPVDEGAQEVVPEVERAPRVLVADDDASILALVQKAFANRGYDIETARDGAEALSRLREQDFEAVVLDLRMPRMNADEIYGRLLEEKPKLARRILFMTGDTVGSKAHDFLTATKAPHLYKPFSIRTVRAAVEKLIAEARGATDEAEN